MLKGLKKLLDQLEPSFIKGSSNIDELIAETQKIFPNPLTLNTKRDLCILGTMAAGAAILAAWVYSGGALTVGTPFGSFIITEAVHAALIGGASAGTIACIIGGCGKC